VSKNKIVMQTPDTTVVSEYISERKTQTSYQSEAESEKSFIEQLKSQAYEYLDINSEEKLISNLRTQLEKLNNYKFSEKE
jgi:type I restriction enzyme R subunit